MNKQLSLLCMGTLLLCSTSASATVLFSDDFEGGLTQWTGKDGAAHHGQIVSDPDLTQTNSAMNFSVVNAAGDIFTSTDAFGAGDYWLSFDYYGDTSLFGPNNSDTGGYVGISQGLPDSHQWLYATGTASGASDVLIDDDSWHSYTFAFNSTFGFHLMLEDFSGSGGGADDAYFDNISLSNTAPIPEPATMLLFSTGLAGLIAVRRKRNNT